MHLLVKYTVNEGMADAQSDALKSFVGDMKNAGHDGYNYTAFATDDPTQFIAVLQFDDVAARARFLESDAFKTYRDGAKDRFPGPPSTTPMRMVASTRF